MAEAGQLGRQLQCGPTDGVTSLEFLQDSTRLVGSSWDGTVGIYDCANDQTLQTFDHKAPVLDAALRGQEIVYSGGLDGQLKSFELSGSNESQVGRHDKAVRCVRWLQERQLLASSSWDCTLKIWDPKMASAQNCIASTNLPGKAFSMSASGNVLAVATSQRQILAYDVRRIEAGQPFVQKESSLKFQTRCLQCFGNAEGYAISSVEGRVAIEYFDVSEASQAKKFAFKCHRAKEGGEDVAHPVNAIAFQPVYGTFATGGCDGVVNMWDKENKKRLAQLSGYPTSIACLAFDSTGNQLAIAASYTFEKGEIDHPADHIYVREMQDSELRPKTRK